MYKFKTNFMLWLASVMPKRLSYWCIIWVWARATTEMHTDKTPDEVTIWMALDNLEGKR
jgi:hypothetical protein